MKASRLIQHIANEIANSGDRDIVIRYKGQIIPKMDVDYCFGKEEIIIDAHDEYYSHTLAELKK